MCQSSYTNFIITITKSKKCDPKQRRFFYKIIFLKRGGDKLIIIFLTTVVLRIVAICQFGLEITMVAPWTVIICIVQGYITIVLLESLLFVPFLTLAHSHVLIFTCAFCFLFSLALPSSPSPTAHSFSPPPLTQVLLVTAQCQRPPRPLLLVPALLC